MATLSPTLPPRRHAPGILAAVLVHAALLLAWQAAQRPPRVELDGAPRAFQWIWLTPPVPVGRTPPRPQAQAPITLPAVAAARRAPPALAATPPTPAADAAAPASTPAAAAAPVTAPADADALQRPAPARSGVQSEMLRRALREAGAVDRALRKENNPVIVAPLDSPQIRLRRGIEAAADAVPNKFYEAPKTDVLVNDTGDGARRTRVKGAFGTYCITERAPTTGVDMIKARQDPAHQLPAARAAGDQAGLAHGARLISAARSGRSRLPRSGRC